MKIYYAHHMWKYGTKIEEFELSVIKMHYPEAEALNPSVFVNGNQSEEEIMSDCFSKIDNSDILVFSDMSGVVGRGVLSEIQHAQRSGKTTYRIVANRLVKVEPPVKYILLNTGSNRVFAEII